jgi:hypothetical protein
MEWEESKSDFLTVSSLVVVVVVAVFIVIILSSVDPSSLSGTSPRGQLFSLSQAARWQESVSAAARWVGGHGRHENTFMAR